MDVGADNAAAINKELVDLNLLKPHEPITRLPLNLLSDGNAYTFKLRVETHVGARSSFAEATVQVLADAPSVTINAPTGMLRSERLVLEPTVNVCGRAATGGLSWQWSARTLGGTGEEIRLQYNSSRSLVVEVNRLPSNETVVFSVSASATTTGGGKGGKEGTSVASVAVKPTPLVASISGGASASRGQEDDLLLDASSSYDPDAATSSAPALSYAWACTGSRYPNRSVAPSCIGQNGEVVVLQDASSSKAKVPQGTLLANHSYTFTVDVTADSRTAAAAISVQVEPIHIDQTHVGQEVALRFASLDQRVTPELFGTVTQISADAFTDENTSVSFYRAEIVLNEGETAKLPEGAVLIPGMPVEAFLRTADQTPFSYLMKPFTDYFRKAFRES